MLNTVYLNGEYLPLSEAKVSVLDRGFLFGDGIYEVIIAYRQKPFLAIEHLERLRKSAHEIGLAVPLSNSEFETIIQNLIDQNETCDTQLIYIEITRGADTTRRQTIPDDLTPTIFIGSIAFKEKTFEEVQKGVYIKSGPDQRWESCHIKSIALLGNLLARVNHKEAFEVILIKNGFLTEGSTSNIFIVKDGIIKTPPTKNLILHGVTRNTVIKLAKKNNLPIEEVEISETECHQADEIWISSTSKEITPAVELDHKPIGAGKAGPVWEIMYRLYQEFKSK